REEQAGDFGDCSGAGGIVAVALLAGPDTDIVQLKPFRGDAPKDHGAEAPVSDREGFGPLDGGLRIPQRQCRNQSFHGLLLLGISTSTPSFTASVGFMMTRSPAA